MDVYNGREKIPQTAEFSFEKPFYCNGMTYDEYYVEWCYYMAWIASREKPYKSLQKQLEDGDITSIPEEYKLLCPYPEICTAFEKLTVLSQEIPASKVS